MPMISTLMATRELVRGLLMMSATYSGVLGLYNMIAHYARWCADGGLSLVHIDAAPVEWRWSFMFPPAVRVGAPRWTVVLGAIVWVMIIVLFVVDEVLGRLLGFTSLRFTHLDDLSNWFSTLSFAASIISTFALQELLNRLQRREVLLWLLGAKIAVAGGISLLLCGIVAVMGWKHLARFLAQASPPPKLCCLVLYVRKYGIFIAYAFPLVYLLLLTRGEASGVGELCLVAAASMAAAGLAASLLVGEWSAGRKHFVTPHRVLMLFPGTTRVAHNRAMAAVKVTTASGIVSAAGLTAKSMFSLIVGSYSKRT
eukprot:NODE_697_length_1401_cov_299.120357.p1 GENE.NODE_697_length_1401_cov_299.120357~~NODE_697_length_1401_cov_299.120357.p1  ORF type:complete len:319 (-),score=88.80 NODE_697_length_1401_cov_299.120357:428-1363(-)